ncbi:ABC transporter substrate-binding protein [Xylophilus sp. GOD-11R]|uniref:ABC transporter substrate-binding protein n=1 Tax=Xylophilus sp. GOD-11R TaxID=3089814 RepID=UPI00298C602A|nr:ABC transporter substrate-binding protein [Xylophilus sp. GOD-11R]WPB55146.1 ABC transporter substrate-binding protein [Xylophilus sp. GOD-11R]
MKRRKLLQTAAATASGLSLAGIPMHLLAAGTKGGTINVALQPEPPSIMIGTISNGPALLVGGNLYEGLLSYDEKLTPQPSLATSWTVSPDGLTYVFKLKPGVKWHDGKPFTSADVVFSIDVFLRKVHARARSNIGAVDTIKALDPLTVEFKLKYPFGPFLGIFPANGMPMVPKHIYEGAVDFLKHPANATPIGTGPFKFKEWSKGSYIQLVKNEQYHTPDMPLVDSLYFHVIPDAAARAAAFESGKIDILPGGSAEYFDVARLAKLPGVQVTTKGWEMFAPLSWITINNRKSPMDKVEFRQALSLALDREGMRKVAWYGYADVATGAFNSHLKYYRADLPKLARDKDKARKLIAASGYKGETIKLLPLPYGETWQRMAEITRLNLQEVGIKVEMVPTDVAGWNQRMNEWDFDLAFNFLYQHGDPALGVARNYTTSNIEKGSPFNNVEGFSDPKIDALFEQGQKETDPAKRQAAYHDVQKLLVEQMPVAWLHELNFPTLYRSRIHNPINSATGLNDGLARAWVA